MQTLRYNTQKEHTRVLAFMKHYFKPPDGDVAIYFSKAFTYLTHHEPFHIQLSYSLKNILKEKDYDTALYLMNEGTNRDISDPKEALDLLAWISEELMIDDTIEHHEYLNEQR